MDDEKVLKAAWWAVVLGLGMELVLLGLALLAGANPPLRVVVADTAQKVSWSVIVCVGLDLGSASSRKDREGAMGLVGLLAAPAAFYVAKILHTATLRALQAAGSGSAGYPKPLTAVIIKAVEYAWLGGAIGFLGKQQAGLKPYAMTGLITGAIVASLIVILNLLPAAPLASSASLFAKAVNEILFPVGCSLVLYASDRSK